MLIQKPMLACMQTAACRARGGHVTLAALSDSEVNQALRQDQSMSEHVAQVAILAGDFLLARASVTLAALRDSEVIELLSQVIEDLVTGEILQVCLYG